MAQQGLIADSRAQTAVEHAKKWQQKTGLTDKKLFADYAERLRNADPAGREQNLRAIGERAHQFVDQSYVERLRNMVLESDDRDR